MTIRRVEKEDLEHGLVDVFIEGFRYHYNRRPDIFSNKSDNELKEEIEKEVENSKMLVILENNKVIGYIAYEIRKKTC